jgi:endonuclease/exonuclease/phosphatase family metal-dependent hydrolase
MISAAACAAAAPPQLDHVRMPVGDCAALPLDGSGRVLTDEVRWHVEAARADRSELDEWCRGAGAPVVASAGRPSAPVVAIAVVTWNVHLGAGRLDAFVTDLRSGALTGQPAPHFVLLLQEVRRRGGGVPARLVGEARAGRFMGDRDKDADIVAVARRLGLHLVYVPSVRNGGFGEAAEDRGNAILASLPLAEPTGIELPLLSQRRVAVAATVPLLDGMGTARGLRVASAHFDYGASRTRPLAPFGAGRALQAAALAHALEGDGDVVVGGDFNTWLPDRLEGALARLRTEFPDFPGGTTAPTFYTGGLLPQRLDHLFMRSVDLRASAPVRIDDRYGSDHFPVMSWLRFASDPG